MNHTDTLKMDEFLRWGKTSVEAMEGWLTKDILISTIEEAGYNLHTLLSNNCGTSVRNQISCFSMNNLWNLYSGYIVQIINR